MPYLGHALTWDTFYNVKRGYKTKCSNPFGQVTEAIGAGCAWPSTPIRIGGDDFVAKIVNPTISETDGPGSPGLIEFRTAGEPFSQYIMPGQYPSTYRDVLMDDGHGAWLLPYYFSPMA